MAKPRENENWLLFSTLIPGVASGLIVWCSDKNTGILITALILVTISFLGVLGLIGWKAHLEIIRSNQDQGHSIKELEKKATIMLQWADKFKVKKTETKNGEESVFVEEGLDIQKRNDFFEEIKTVLKTQRSA